MSPSRRTKTKLSKFGEIVNTINRQKLHIDLWSDLNSTRVEIYMFPKESEGVLYTALDSSAWMWFRSWLAVTTAVELKHRFEPIIIPFIYDHTQIKNDWELKFRERAGDEE